MEKVAKLFLGGNPLENLKCRFVSYYPEFNKKGKPGETRIYYIEIDEPKKMRKVGKNRNNAKFERDHILLEPVFFFGKKRGGKRYTG